MINSHEHQRVRIRQMISTRETYMLGSTFIWADTPQGRDYWERKSVDGTSLSDDDIAYFRTVIREPIRDKGE